MAVVFYRNNYSSPGLTHSWNECAKFRGSRAIVPSWVRNFFSRILGGSETFSRVYFMGTKFLLGQTQALVRKMLDAIFITNITAVHRSLILMLIFIICHINSFYPTDILKLHY